MDEEELWNDDLIIDAYDRAMASVNQRVEDLMRNPGSSRQAATKSDARKEETQKSETPKEGPVDATTSHTAASHAAASHTAASHTSSMSVLPASPTSQCMPNADQSSTKDDQANTENTEKRWSEGDYCRAIYEEDGKPYEAIIVSIESDSCRIRYLAYENEEIKRLDELSPSAGKAARKEQERQCLEEKLEALSDQSSESEADEFASNEAQASNRSYPPLANQSLFSPPHLSTNGKQHGKPANILIPPPPTSLPPMPSLDENELLTTTLMSWYMSGYHTGYFQAIRDLKRSNN